ncbi:ABC transporter substrate-binding protein [Actinocrispum wychmicini]|uniref:Peptide/nickel transport system substrate-binding protein n=1 Tax=Actinocrispum wychmicini TaxID=1213861 RepID=A0A4V6NNV1_9PSEU|nr:ABC transporter substrate-binding protein [Actinocrispum wychmicini]TCO56620.1 peptide/nickel transport system substrate-binding protein [Actinocrispum wychmicini]
MSRPRFNLRCALLIVALAPVVGCTAAPTPTASGGTDSTALVLAVPNEPTSVNPLAGYGEDGAAKLYDGLLEHQADLSLAPTLATDLPTPSADGKSWSVPLRGDVKFADGSAFDAQDVIATYKALLDPAYQSPLRDRYSMITNVTEVPTTTPSATTAPPTSSRPPTSATTPPKGSVVRFDLAQPYAPFPDLLVLGILPSEAFAQPAPVNQPGAQAPVGTGPYQLQEWKHGESMTLRANTSYFGGAPTVARVTIQFVPDDETRARLIRDGKLDSAVLPPALAKTFDKADAFAVLPQHSAGVEAVFMPAGNPVTADPTIRLALNYAMNRQNMVDGPLAGRGTPASTPVSPVLAEFFEPSAKFAYDVKTAKALLDAGGWVAGSNGIRMKGPTQAQFTIAYPAGDTVARDLATAFAADADAVGVQVLTKIGAPAPTDATVRTVGEPFDPDLALYPLLHGDPKLAVPLDAARATTDPAQRAVAYRQLQRTYIEGPTMVVLAGVDHTYLLRRNWTGYQPVVDGAGQDATWGPWWNLQQWKPR